MLNEGCDPAERALVEESYRAGYGRDPVAEDEFSVSAELLAWADDDAL